MAKQSNFLDIVLLNKEYRVACPPEEHGALLAAVAYVDEKMRDIAEKTKSNVTERIAVMVALNVAHDYLSLQAAEPGAQTSLSNASEASTNNLHTAEMIRAKLADMEDQLQAALVR
ncbi:MAG: cell division protein ZapA [Pseudomonadota bacterium]